MRAPAGPGIAAGEVLLAVEDVSLAFGGVKAVTGVSFDIRKGEIRAIIGPNGAGKTSMLNVINGFYHPQRGRITFKGDSAPAHAPVRGRARRHCAHLPECRAVQGHDRARQHHGRAHPQDAPRLLLAAAAVRTGAGRGGRASQDASRRSSISSRSSTSARSWSASCPTDCRSASSSAGRSPWSPICCCSTSPWPA